MSKIHDFLGGMFCHMQLNASTRDFLSPLTLQKMKEDNISQLGDYDAHSVYNNTRMGLAISLCSNSNHSVSLVPPKLPQILDIYSVVAL